MNGLCVLWIAIFLPLSALANLAPFKVQCSVYAHGFPGVPDTETDWKQVTLEGESDSVAGHRLVDEIGDYSFWVVTREVITPPKVKKRREKRPEIHAYNAEIRNKATGVVARARSSGKGEAPDGTAFQASVALLTYSKEPGRALHEAGQLSFHCRHPSKR